MMSGSSVIPDFLSSLTCFVEGNQFDIDEYREGGDLLLLLWCLERFEKVIKTGPSPSLNKLSAIPDFISHLSSLTRSLQDSFVNDHLCLGEDSDAHERDEDYEDESRESYIEDDEEWPTDFMEDSFYESQKYSDEEASQILGLPSKGIKCEGENICAICLDPLEKCDGDMKELPCKHMYHYSCILESTKVKNTCPTCRGEYDCSGKDDCERVDSLYFPFEGSWIFTDIRPMCLFEEYEIFERKVVRPPPTWLSLSLDYDVWGRGESPLIFFEQLLLKHEREEAFALFDKGAKGSGSLGKRKEFDGKKEYGTWHVKALACKEKYDYKSILGSTKVRSMEYMITSLSSDPPKLGA